MMNYPEISIKNKFLNLLDSKKYKKNINSISAQSLNFKRANDTKKNKSLHFSQKNEIINFFKNQSFSRSGILSLKKNKSNPIEVDRFKINDYEIKKKTLVKQTSFMVKKTKIKELITSESKQIKDQNLILTFLNSDISKNKGMMNDILNKINNKTKQSSDFIKVKIKRIYKT